MIENKYVGLKIYNNFNWKAILRKLEKNNYRWASGDKPTGLYFDTVESIVYIDPITKTLVKSSITTISDKNCNYYIEVR